MYVRKHFTRQSFFYDFYSHNRCKSHLLTYLCYGAVLEILLLYCSFCGFWQSSALLSPFHYSESDDYHSIELIQQDYFGGGKV